MKKAIPAHSALVNLPVSELAPAAAAGKVVLHFYDLTCPFCYVGQFKSALLENAGLTVVELPFQAHPDVPLAGQTITTRTGPMYETLAVEAQRTRLPLHWQPHLPNSRLALAAAEWARQHQPDRFTAYQRALFRAHFAEELTIGDEHVLLRLATDQGLDSTALQQALADGTAAAAVAQAGHLGQQLGVTGTPAWVSAGHALIGNQPAATFARFATYLTANTQ